VVLEEIELERLKRVKKKLQGSIDDIRTEVIELSQRIHANPETAFNEVKASTWLSDYLEQNGFEVTRGIAGLKTAFHAIIGALLPWRSGGDMPKIGHARS
jgi:metal-dependent amidase/aminoacylase/carboxypeptidase family protein